MKDKDHFSAEKRELKSFLNINWFNAFPLKHLLQKRGNITTFVTLTTLLLFATLELKTGLTFQNYIKRERERERKTGYILVCVCGCECVRERETEIESICEYSRVYM